jgi:hypothetical protein
MTNRTFIFCGGSAAPTGADQPHIPALNNERRNASPDRSGVMAWPSRKGSTADFLATVKPRTPPKTRKKRRFRSVTALSSRTLFDEEKEAKQQKDREEAKNRADFTKALKELGVRAARLDDGPDHVASKNRFAGPGRLLSARRWDELREELSEVADLISDVDGEPDAEAMRNLFRREVERGGRPRPLIPGDQARQTIVPGVM